VNAHHSGGAISWQYLPGLHSPDAFENRRMRFPTFAIARCALARGLAILLIACSAASAADIKLLGGSAVIPVMTELIATFEQSTGHKVRSDFDGAIGQMTDRLAKGEAADVVIVSGAQVDRLIREGKVVPGSRVDIAKVGVGVFERKGAAKLDIGSVDALKRALAAAQSIGYNDPATGAPVSIYLLELFERLGIAAEMTAKTTVFKQRSDRFAAVARGDVEIGFNQISEIVAAPGVDLIGPLPPAIQRYTLFATGIVAGSLHQDAGRAFVNYISSPEARVVWQAKGFEAP
jgi:molybdate transport system substrate-binding protein